MTIERLDLRNSGDTAGPRDRVVGYGAWALYEARPRATLNGTAIEAIGADADRPGRARSILFGLDTGAAAAVIADRRSLAPLLAAPGAAFVTLRRPTVRCAAASVRRWRRGR